MGRNQTGNKNNYHYVVETFNNDDQFEDRQYYITSKEIMRRYGCCQKSFFNHVKSPSKKSKKLGNIKIYRINEPVYTLLPNPDLV